MTEKSINVGERVKIIILIVSHEMKTPDISVLKDIKALLFFMVTTSRWPPC